MKPPLLEILYDEVDTTDLLDADVSAARKRAKISFNVEYSMDTVQFWKVAEAFFILFSIAAGLLVVLVLVV